MSIANPPAPAPAPAPKKSGASPLDPSIVAELASLESHLAAIEQHKQSIGSKIPDGVPILRRRGDNQAFFAVSGRLVFRPVYYLEDLQA